MTVFACKEAFASLGLEQIKASHAHASQDCSICLDPLAVHPNHKSDQSSNFHAAVRVVTCGHVLGKECLDAWLDIGNTCPTCSRMLFEATGDPVTQKDVNEVLQALGPVYGEDIVMGEVARLMALQEEEHARLRQIQESEMANMRAMESRVPNDGFTLSSDDFLDSDVEDSDGEEDMDFVGHDEGTSESV